MKITNKQCQWLYNWLNTNLHGEQSRARNRFVSIIEQQYYASLDGRTEILKKYADKDKKTKEAIIENGYYKTSDKNIEVAKKEVNAFQDKVTTYTIAKKDIPVVKMVVKILAEAKLPLDIPAGKVYDEVMNELEAVK